MLRAVPLLAIVALVLPGAGSTAGSFPAFYELSDAQELSTTVGVDFDFENLDSAGETERIVLTVPSAYGVDLAHAPGKNVGGAHIVTVPIGGGAATDFTGGLVASSAQNDQQGCGPGSHTAVWQLQTRSKTGLTLDVPIVIDHAAAGYTLSACFDAEHAQGREISLFEFYPASSIATPSHPGKYLFDATVTPFASDGSASPPTAYEVRAYETLPQDLTAAPTYDPRTKMLSVSGKLTVQGKGAAGKQIEIDGGPTTKLFKKVGVATTLAGGVYLFKKRFATMPRFVYSQIEAESYGVCSGSSAAPGGCASYSLGGTGSPTQRTTTR
jgi:hypothetical protein